MKKLPKKPSKLLALALQDLELAEKTPGYKIAMAMWHDPQGDGCAVCMAGAVMAFSLGVDVHERSTPSSHQDERLQAQLRAIDNFRLGQVGEGLYRMNALNKDGTSPVPDRSICTYHESPEIFKQHIQKLISDLQEAGR